MERYKNLGGNSGVVAYEVGSDFIRVQFFDGAIYRYTYASTGADHVERMKLLAGNGRGLNTLINTAVRNAYAQKER